MDIKYNNIQHQYDDSECGVYSITFILKMLEGHNFDDFINNFRRTRGNVDSESDFDDDDNDGYSRSRKKLSNRNVTGAKNSDFRGGSRGKKKPNYREELSDHNSSSERENRRPLRAAAKRNRFVSRSGRNDSDLDDSDDEEPRRRLSHASADTAPAAMTDDDPIS